MSYSQRRKTVNKALNELYNWTPEQVREWLDALVKKHITELNEADVACISWLASEYEINIFELRIVQMEGEDE